MIFINKEIKRDINVIINFIDEEYYSKYFFLSFLITKKIASYHYCLIGWKKKYNPTINFSTYFYLEKNKDVKNLKVNPFKHFCEFGKQEERTSKVLTDFEYYRYYPTFTYKTSIITKLVIKLFIKNEEVELFSSYFDKNEYRRNIRFWKILYIKPALMIHYFLKGKKQRTKPSQFYYAGENKKSFIDVIKILLDKKILDSSTSYDNWIFNHEKTGKLEYQSLAEKLNYKPLISVIIPVYNAKIKLLEEAIESVKNQAYENWEICIADDYSTDKNLIKYLKKIKEEEKIKVVFRKENGHISKCSNNALEIAKGEYIALLDQDDIISTNALYEVVTLLNKTKGYNLIFSNEDKINEDGTKRFKPHFKKGWNYHLLLSQNMVSHLGVYKKSIIDKIGGFRVGYEGSQDYDLLLRFIEEIDESTIGFIDKILYHWRAIEGSTAMNVDQKSYSVNTGIKALQDHLDRTGQMAKAIPSKVNPNYYRVKRELVSTPLVSILIPTRNLLSDLKTVIDSVLNNNSYENYELIILDNDSDEEDTITYLKQISVNSKVKVLHCPGEFNYSAINNKGVKESSGELILLLNNDTKAINETWLEEMVSQIQPNNVSIVGAKLLYFDNTIQHAGVQVGMGGVAGHLHLGLDKDAQGDTGRIQLIQNFDAVTAACLLIKKEDFNKVGGLNEKDLKVAFNDVDLCLKVRQLGKKIVYTPYAELYHFESKSRGSDLTPDKQERFKRECDYIKQTWLQDFKMPHGVE